MQPQNAGPTQNPDSGRFRWIGRLLRPALRSALLLLAAAAAGPNVRAEDRVIAWNQLALDAIRFANTPPPTAARQLAILHLALFDAVNGLGGPYLNYRPHGPPPAGASPTAAAAAAANRVLRLTYPQFTLTFDATLEAHLLALPAGPAKTDGVAWGRKVAQDLLTERDFDGASFGIDYRTTDLPGHWRPTPPLFVSALLPQWPGVQPFTLERGDQFRPPPPPEFSSPAWLEEWNEVRVLGAANSSVRTAEQTEIAWFWADGVGTETPPGHWNEVAAQLARARNLNDVDSARLFALVNLALADAGIATWDAKYVYDLWRPITAIRSAETDSNPATMADPTWTPLILTPPFPEYVSGHSTFSRAAATALAAVAGSDEFDFALRSDGLFGATRSWSRFSAAALEAGRSRIYGGIHFSSANREGQKLGESIGHFVTGNFLLPTAAVRLVIVREKDQIVLRWPAALQLQSCGQLVGGEWVREPGYGFRSVPADQPPRFYRLARE